MDDKKWQFEGLGDASSQASAAVEPASDQKPTTQFAAPDGGVIRIGQERVRQVMVEGWTPEHDDEHKAGEMLRAAGCYMKAGTMLAQGQLFSWAQEYAAVDWPWHGRAMWKPAEDPIRNLEKAGALIAAEIDRLIRARAAGE